MEPIQAPWLDRASWWIKYIWRHYGENEPMGRGYSNLHWATRQLHMAAGSGVKWIYAGDIGRRHGET